jgi:hypothetical protein
VNKNLFEKEKFWMLLSFLVPLMVYVVTLAPTVTFIDSGELATACYQLNTAHPTGYPLFTLLGRLFTLIPIFSPIYILNLMSAVFTAVAVAVTFKLLIEILNRINSGYKFSVNKNLITYITAFSGSLILAFSKTYWDTAESIEVYNLHKIFLSLILYLFIKASYRDNSERYWILFAFVLGLSFGNHLSTLFLSVGSIYFYFAINSFNKVSLQRLLILSIPFIAGLSIYLYLPLRGEYANIAWGYPVNWDNFIRHISGKQFSVWMFSSSDVPAKQFKYFLNNYPLEFVYLPLILSVFGLFAIFKKNIKIFIFTTLLFVFNILYAINYDIYDIDSYFILAFLVTAIWSTAGFYFILEKIKTKSTVAVLVAALIIPGILLFSNFKENNESKNYFVENYADNVMKSVRPNSIIISTQWDFFVSASWYYQNVSGMYKGISVIDKELLRRTWYLREMRKHFPDIYNNCKMEFELYEAELIKFENETDRYTKPKTQQDNQDLLRIRTTFLSLLNAIIEKNPERNIYLSFEVEDVKGERFAEQYQRIPEGLLFRLSKSTEFDSSFAEPDFVYKLTDNTYYHYEFIMQNYLRAFLLRANYLMNYGKFDEAEKYIKRGLEIENSTGNNIPKGDSMRLMNKLKQLKTIK